MGGHLLVFVLIMEAINWRHQECLGRFFNQKPPDLNWAWGKRRFVLNGLLWSHFKWWDY